MEEILGDTGVRCICLNNAKLGERKNCNLPGVMINLPVLQEKDVHDLTKFGIPQVSLNGAPGSRIHSVRQTS